MNDPTAPPDTVRVLRAAADVIERNGLHKNGFYDAASEAEGCPPRDCPVCVHGALDIACGGDPGNSASGTSHAAGALRRYLLRVPGGRGLIRWNDDPARTAADVIAVLRDCADQLEQEKR